MSIQRSLMIPEMFFDTSRFRKIGSLAVPRGVIRGNHELNA